MRQFLLTTALVFLGLLPLASVLLGVSVPIAAFAAPFHPDAWEAMSEEERIRLSPEPSNSALAVLSQATASHRRWTPHPRTLVLLVDFEDKPSSPGYDIPHFESLLFELDRELYGSLRDYYREATYNKIDVTGKVYGWFRMPLHYVDYADGQQGFGGDFPRSAKGLTHHALEAAVEAGVDITQFDSDGPDGIPNSGDDDGVIDALMIVHAGFGTERTRSLDDIRSHYWTTVGDLQIDGIRIPDYAMVPELENVGIMVHEYGHLLGAPDLYDLSGRGNGLGWFSVMAWAIWYNNGREPGGPDPYTSMMCGVLKPEVPGGDEPRLTMPAINHNDYALRLWTEGAVGKEYFLVEYRKTMGIDRYLFGDGLLIYHVDERAMRQDNPARYLVRLVQADGHRSLE
ncbi:MAG: M6 family metalloprotease domain-containing protein, partial [Candidatus Eisenbacteria bacterium]|nr:M6 family metalloprotease domain-containing protein [Candidatus Eisenbacteria bacterium]